MGKPADQKSPRIISIKWGHMEVESLGSGKDFKLWPGGGRNWDWGETGTKHMSGIQMQDCQELIEKGCSTIVLSRGMFLRLKVTKELVFILEQKGLTVVVCETKKAVKQYNKLADQGEKVGGLFHTTC